MKPFMTYAYLKEDDDHEYREVSEWSVDGYRDEEHAKRDVVAGLARGDIENPAEEPVATSERLVIIVKPF